MAGFGPEFHVSEFGLRYELGNARAPTTHGVLGLQASHVVDARAKRGA
jgi:hypothetical protein